MSWLDRLSNARLRLLGERSAFQAVSWDDARRSAATSGNDENPQVTAARESVAIPAADQPVAWSAAFPLGRVKGADTRPFMVSPEQPCALVTLRPPTRAHWFAPGAATCNCGLVAAVDDSDIVLVPVDHEDEKLEVLRADGKVHRL